MKARLLAVGISLFLVLLILSGVVYAPWSTLNTGYAVTSNVHGVDVPLGTPVTVTAGTLDSFVTQVTFRWRGPPDGNGPIEREETHPISNIIPSDVPQEVLDYVNSSTVWYAQDTYTPIDPLDVGDWGVQVFFRDSTGRDRANLTNVIAIKATSFNSIPEIPVGTIAAAVAMFIALGVFVVKRKRIPTILHRAK